MVQLTEPLLWPLAPAMFRSVPVWPETLHRWI